MIRARSKQSIQTELWPMLSRAVSITHADHLISAVVKAFAACVQSCQQMAIDTVLHYLMSNSLLAFERKVCKNPSAMVGAIYKILLQ